MPLSLKVKSETGQKEYGHRHFTPGVTAIIMGRVNMEEELCSGRHLV
jgi:hypothetical protein